MSDITCLIQNCFPKRNYKCNGKENLAWRLNVCSKEDRCVSPFPKNAKSKLLRVSRSIWALASAKRDPLSPYRVYPLFPYHTFRSLATQAHSLAKTKTKQAAALSPYTYNVGAIKKCASSWISKAELLLLAGLFKRQRRRQPVGEIHTHLNCELFHLPAVLVGQMNF